MRVYDIIFSLLAIAMACGDSPPRPKALVYRGPTTCDGCPESVAALLISSPSNFEVKFVGPNEKIDTNEASLQGVDLYAHPGGDNLDKAWEHTKQYKTAIRNFVANGGRYAGFCLGAFLAGSSPGYGLLPHGTDTDAEIDQPGAQVKDMRDTVIQVNWSFQTGPNKGQEQKGRWVYFQDGAVIDLPPNSPGFVLGTYSSNGDIAASVSPFGKGWVGLVGPHPEADETWYQLVNVTNPEGVRSDIGHDFVESIMAQPRGT